MPVKKKNGVSPAGRKRLAEAMNRPVGRKAGRFCGETVRARETGESGRVTGNGWLGPGHGYVAHVAGKVPAAARSSRIARQTSSHVTLKLP